MCIITKHYVTSSFDDTIYLAAQKEGKWAVIRELKAVIYDLASPGYSHPWAKWRSHSVGRQARGRKPTISMGYWNCNGAFCSSLSTLRMQLGLVTSFSSQRSTQAPCPQETRSDSIRGFGGGHLSYTRFPPEQGYYVIFKWACQIFVGPVSSEWPPPLRYLYCKLLFPTSLVTFCTSQGV